MSLMKEKTFFSSLVLLAGIALAFGVFALFLAVYH
jgi:hypothetical protein